MISLLKTYWFELVMVFLSIISFVIVLIRSMKNKDSEEIKNMISEVLPGFINLAEASGVCGSAKLMFVVDSVLKRIKRYTSTKDEQYWMSFIRERVENILSTPQKKEVKE